MKTLALIARRRDISRDEFRDHYEQVHAPLAVRTLLEGTTRYVRNHLREELHGRAAFDVVTAFWYRDTAAAIAVMRRTETPVGEPVREDELTFMDKPANTFFAVAEHAVLGAEDPRAALARLRSCGGRPAPTRASSWPATRRSSCRCCSTPRARPRGACRIARSAPARASPRSTR